MTFTLPLFITQPRWSNVYLQYLRHISYAILYGQTSTYEPIFNQSGINTQPSSILQSQSHGHYPNFMYPEQTTSPIQLYPYSMNTGDWGQDPSLYGQPSMMNAHAIEPSLCIPELPILNAQPYYDHTPGFMFNGNLPTINEQLFDYDTESTYTDLSSSSVGDASSSSGDASSSNGASPTNTNASYHGGSPNSVINARIEQPPMYSNTEVPHDSEPIYPMLSHQLYESVPGMVDYNFTATPPAEVTIPQPVGLDSDATPVDVNSPKIGELLGWEAAQDIPLNIEDQTAMLPQASPRLAHRNPDLRRSKRIRDRSEPVNEDMTLAISTLASDPPIASGSGVLQSSVAPKKTRTKKTPRKVTEMKNPLYCKFQGCSKLVDGRWEMNQHMIKHERISKFVCPVNGCESRFKWLHDLERHDKSVHEGIITYQRREEKRLQRLERQTLKEKRSKK
ncbi:hypothetical protein DFH28DRAFT_928990 [Melampsora americana]|nr:hypothetical protein DFH28DRAFT_928990 [Melampsora americana]